MRYTPRVRAVIACVGLTACFTRFSARLVELQVSRHDEYTRLAALKHVNKQTIYAKRGSIQDARGEILADNEPLKTVIADGSLIPNASKVAAEIAGLLEIPEAKLQATLTTPRKYVVLKTEVPEATAAEIARRMEAKKLKGIYFEQSFRRFYPNGTMLCHVIGCTNGEHEGIEGIERSMETYLKGQPGFRFIERDRTGKELVPYRGQERPARDGCNVRLTVDMGLQSILETELDAAYKQYRPEVAIAIMMEPKSGRILAMANRPGYDPNQAGETDASLRRNCAVMNMVEPGSTFKIVTAAAALNEKVVNLDTMIGCEGGRFNFAGKILHDHGHGDHPDLSVADVLVKSSNIGAAKLAMRLGDHRFYEYIRAFGFGERTGVNLPWEISGRVSPPHRWSKISIARIPMGQGVGVTPLQMAAAMCAVAHGGKLMMPQIVDSVCDGNGTPIVTYAPRVVRQVVDPETTVKVNSALKDVVSKRGTAVLAAVPGFTVAGKTGTAEKSDGHGAYLHNRYVTSFIGFMPVEDPRFVCVVMLDDPKASSESLYGGTLAAPVFARVGERAARYLNLQPDPTLMPPPPGQKVLTRLTKAGH